MVAYHLVFAILATVKAEHTFANPYVTAWLTGTFTGAIAQFAIGAFVLVFTNSPDSKPSEDAEQCAEGTNKSTIEAGDDEVEEDRREKY